MRVVGVLMVVLLAAGCSGRGGSVESSFPSAAPSVASSSPSVSVSPSVFESFPPAGEESGDRAAVRAGWLEYWRVYDKFMSDPARYTDLTEVGQVASDEAMTMTITEIRRFRDRGWRSQGGLRFSKVEVGEPGASGTDRAAVVTYCIDTSELVVLDKEGRRVNEEPRRLRETASMVEGADGKWRMVQVRNLRDPSC